MGFAHRGIVEGYYGPPYSHEERLCWLERLGGWGMNRYVYAPKDDPLHRAAWRTRYPADALARFAALCECGAEHGVDFAMGISPGLTMEYGAADDQRDLTGKLAPLAACGVRWFALALDDVPAHLTHPGDRRAFPSLAAAHVATAHALLDGLGQGARLWLVPTDYLGVAETEYLAELGEGLDAAIEVGWTGRTVVSPEIRAEEAAARASTLRRPLLLWDNYPVADGPMRSMLHLGPYRGRDPALEAHASGVLLNPMQHPRASAPAVRTAAAYLADPAGYDAESAWQEALAELGAGSPRAFARFAEAHRFSALCGDRDRELEQAFRELEREPGGVAADTMAALLDERLAVADALRADLLDRTLAAELEPWIAAHHEETRRMHAALRLLAALGSEQSRLDKALAFMRFEAGIQAPPPAAASYGPRRVLYPQLVSMRDDEAGFGADPALLLGRNLCDEVVAHVERAALAALTRS